MASIYPETPADRTSWIASLRGPKNALQPDRPYAYLAEDELDALGKLAPTATLFLTNKECLFKCLMCDLWQNTLDATVEAGSIPRQIEFALEQLGGASRYKQIKLYNAGSFFDRKAIPPEDYAEIARLVGGFERVIVECHPAFIDERTVQFAEMLNGSLEVALGLETVHPKALEQLNKRVSLDQFRASAEFLTRSSIDLRTFILVRPPFLTEEEGVLWAERSIDFSAEVGAGVAVVIPTRAGNGAMEALKANGEFHPPAIESLEVVLEYGVLSSGMRVFADLWDIEKTFECVCAPERASRMDIINRTQTIPSPIRCARCQPGAR